MRSNLANQTRASAALEESKSKFNSQDDDPYILSLDDIALGTSVAMNDMEYDTMLTSATQNDSENNISGAQGGYTPVNQINNSVKAGKKSKKKGSAAMHHSVALSSR